MKFEVKVFCHKGSKTRSFFFLVIVVLLSGISLLVCLFKFRFSYLDPLNHIQVELLRRYRAGDKDERSRRGIHLTINGIAAGLRNSG